MIILFDSDSMPNNKSDKECFHAFVNDSVLYSNKIIW